MDRAINHQMIARKLPKWIKSLWRNKVTLLGISVVFITIIVAILGPFIISQSPLAGSLRARLLPPGSQQAGVTYYLGTDALGRDLLSQLVYGARVSLTVGVLSVVLGGAIGVVLGLLSATGGPLLDTIIMRIADIQLSFPSFLLALALLAVFGPGLVNVILVLAISDWVQYARVTRAQALNALTFDYIEAARAIGARPVRLILHHILPNSLSPLIVIASFGVARAIIAESSLSFLGIGVSPDIPTWGGILARGRDYIRDAWWLVTMPGVAIAVNVLGINLLGDWIRDFFDPRQFG